MMENPLIVLTFGILIILLGIFFFWPRKGLFYSWRKKKAFTLKILREHIAKDIQKKSLDGEKLDIKELSLLNAVEISKITEAVLGMEQDALLTEIEGFYSLTESGQELATKVIRAHRIYERYLADQTGYDETEWHEKAHDYEHILSTEQVEEISRKLGHPVHDPHGDLIPTKEGEYFKNPGLLLADAPLNKALQIISIPDEPAELASLVLGQNIVPDEVIRVTEIGKESVQFVHDGRKHVLPIKAAKFVKVRRVAAALEIMADSVPLSALKQGQAAKVEHISPHVRGQERRRFMDLGILRDWRLNND